MRQRTTRGTIFYTRHKSLNIKDLQKWLCPPPGGNVGDSFENFIPSPGENVNGIDQMSSEGIKFFDANEESEFTLGRFRNPKFILWALSAPGISPAFTSHDFRDIIESKLIGSYRFFPTFSNAYLVFFFDRRFSYRRKGFGLWGRFDTG